jgi:Txe/YoeB family toxin of toxin-antitoxin system
VSWQLVFSKYAQKDAKKLAAAGLKSKAQDLLAILANDPFQTPPPYEKLVGDLAGAYSRRINIQHRLVYEVFAEERVVRVLRMWSHYEQGDGRRGGPRRRATVSKMEAVQKEGARVQHFSVCENPARELFI